MFRKTLNDYSVQKLLSQHGRDRKMTKICLPAKTTREHKTRVRCSFQIQHFLRFRFERKINERRCSETRNTSIPETDLKPTLFPVLFSESSFRFKV